MLANDIKIQKAIEPDLQGIRSLLETVNLSSEDSRGPLDLSITTNGDTLYLVARADGKIIGSVGLEVYDSVALLKSLAVHPKYRGQGLGIALTRKILSYAIDTRIKEVYLLTTAAKDFFSRFGFERIALDMVNPIVRETSQFKGACPSIAAIMRRLIMT